MRRAAVLLVVTALLTVCTGGGVAASSAGRAQAGGGGPGRSAPPGAGRGTGRPLQIRSALLSQHGQDLVWRLELKQPFSPGALARNGRSLCLLFERPANGSVAGHACLIGPARGRRSPRLVYMRVSRSGLGPGKVIPAAISRSSTKSLTARFLPGHVGWGYNRLRWQVISTLRPPACVPLVPDRVGCYALFPRRPTLVRLHVPVPVGCVPAGSSLVFNGPRNKREVALTFDDGPWNTPPTSQFLDVLERYHAVATFFEIGEQIRPYDPGGRLERRMLADGDMIGNHTWSHPDMTQLDASGQASQLNATSATIRATSGFQPCLWRPPYGSENSGLVALARSLGLITVNWDVDTVDWSLPGTATIYQRAVSGAQNGSIILQHFGGGPRYETLAAVPGEITTLRRRGFQLVTVTQLLGLRVIYR